MSTVSFNQNISGPSSAFSNARSVNKSGNQFSMGEFIPGNVQVSTLTSNAPQALSGEKYSGDRLPAGKAGPAAHFAEVRSQDIQSLQDRLARPQTLQNTFRTEKLQHILDFMQTNPTASFTDAMKNYQKTVRKDSTGPIG